MTAFEVYKGSCMKLYFRADTRPPEAIFSEGFKPRSPMAALEKKAAFVEPTPWWLYGLSSLTQRGGRQRETEIYSSRFKL